MGKVTRLKGDLDDVDALLEIISVIKDVATNRFFTFAQRKANFQKFFEVFMDFFQIVQNIETECPLLRNDNKGVTLFIVSSDQAFMAQLNSRLTSLALQQSEKNPGAAIACLGKRVAEKLRAVGLTNIEKIFTTDQYPDRYTLSLAIREYLVSRIMEGHAGKVILIHLWAKNFTIVKPRILTLLPASELIRTGGGDITEEDGQEMDGQSREDKYKLLLESPPDKIMKALADIWIHSRLFELLSDILLVEAAIQAQQLESAMESLGSEKKGLLVSFRKAGRDEMNKAMREVFTQSGVAKGGRR